MRFLIKLEKKQGEQIPINYSYPLSAAIYRVIAKGDVEYADFLHGQGYGKGFKLFTFSQLNGPFKLAGDRLSLSGPEASFQVAFHLPEAMESFVKGLFQSERIDIADKQSKISFSVKSVESLPNPLQQFKENELVNIQLKPLSPIVAGLQNDKGNYDFLSPEDPRFVESLVYNWRSKISTCYDEQTAADALLMMDIISMKYPFKSRLMTIKANTPEQTRIRGWMNLGLKLTGEKRFVELLLNAGAGVYNSMGCGCVDINVQ